MQNNTLIKFSTKQVFVLWVNEKKHQTILKSYDFYSFKTEFEIGYENSFGHYIVEIFTIENGRKKKFDNMDNLYDYYISKAENTTSKISLIDRLKNIIK